MANKKQSGKGYTLARGAAVGISFVPLAAICFGVQRILDSTPQTTSGTWTRGGLFVLSILLTSFTYDTLKAFLTLPPKKFLEVWGKTKVMWVSVLIYIIAIVALALVPFDPTSYIDAGVNVALVVIALLGMFYATKNFVEAALTVTRS